MSSGFVESIVASDKKRYLTAIASIILSAFFGAAVEQLGSNLPRAYTPVQTVWSRYLVHLLFMLALIAPRKRSGIVRTNRLALQISRALLMAAMPLCFIGSVAILPVQVVWVISWCSVMLILLLSRWVLHERVATCSWIAAASGWLGIWIMSGVDLTPISWRYLAPIGMGSCYAIYVVLTRLMDGESTQTKLFHTALWPFLVLSILVPFQWKMPSLHVAAIYISIGLSGYLFLFFLDKSIELAPVSLAAPLIYTVPLWSFIQEFIITQEMPSAAVAIGASIIVATSVIIVLAVFLGRFRFGAVD